MKLCPDQEYQGQTLRFLGILSKNREEWNMSDIACLRSSTTIVPFFESLGSDAIAFIINQTELTTMCLEGKQLDNIVKIKKTQTPTLKTLICFDKVPEEKVPAIKEAGLEIYSFWDIVDIGRKLSEDSVKLEQPKPEDYYMFCYTSGTTGDPKGVMISHGGFTSCMHLKEWFEVNVNEEDIYISYLPLGHCFEQCFFILSLFKGIKHGFYSGDPLKLLDDL